MIAVDMINGKHIFVLRKNKAKKNFFPASLLISSLRFFCCAQRKNCVFKSHEKLFYPIFFAATAAAPIRVCIVINVVRILESQRKKKRKLFE
jgi:hypothetical protein